MVGNRKRRVPGDPSQRLIGIRPANDGPKWGRVRAQLSATDGKPTSGLMICYATTTDRRSMHGLILTSTHARVA